MFQLMLWFIVLIMLLLFCYNFSDRGIITPEIIFLAGFIPQVIQAFFYVNKFEIDLSDETLFVLILGSILFVFVSFWSERFFRKFKKRTFQNSQRYKASRIDKAIIVVFTVFEVLTVLVTIYFLVSAYGTSLQRAIYLFRAQSMVGYHGVDIEVRMPGWLRLAKRITTASGYFWGYVLMQQIILKNKENRKLIIANFLLSAANSFISTGGRKGIFLLVIATLMNLYIVYEISTNWKRRMKPKTVIMMIVFGFVFVGTFKIAGEAAGKTINYDFGDYLAVYLSAPLKNLDIFIREGTFGISDISQSASFAHLVQYFNARGYLNPYQDSFTYNHVNGINIGNAYTTYFSYLHDFGYIGLVTFVTFSALLCQYLFQKIKKANAYDISAGTILYSYLVSNLAFSFFGNFFITSIFDMTFFWNLFVWIGLSIIVKVKFVIRRR